MPNVASSARFFTQQTSLPLSAISDNADLFLDVHQRRLRPMSRRSSDGGERRVPDCLSVVRGKQFSRIAVPAFGRKCVFGTAPVNSQASPRPNG